MKMNLASVGTVILLAATFAAPASGPVPPPHASRSAIRALDLTGDLPPTTVGSFTGLLDVAVVGVAQDTTTSSGTFTLAGLPAGATIQAAWFVEINYGSSVSATATFAAQSLGTTAPTYVDPGYPLGVWRYSVTSLVTGNGSYAFSMTGLDYPFGAALVVVYAHPSLPMRTVVVNMGGEDLQGASSTTSFAGMPAAGAGRLVVFTGADDTIDTAGEALAFNGTSIPGVTFSQNLGNYTSLISQAVTVQAGTNTATVTTGADNFAWAIAVLSGPAIANESVVPTLSGVGLAVFALAIAALALPLVLRRATVG